VLLTIKDNQNTLKQRKGTQKKKKKKKKMIRFIMFHTHFLPLYFTTWWHFST